MIIEIQKLHFYPCGFQHLDVVFLGKQRLFLLILAATLDQFNKILVSTTLNECCPIFVWFEAAISVRIFRPGKQSKPQNREEVKEWFENTQAYNISSTHSFPPWLHGRRLIFLQAFVEGFTVPYAQCWIEINF